MSPSFDLVHEPWIPCIDLDGNFVALGILDTLEWSHRLRSLHDPSPLVTVSLHRLLLAVLHRVFGPKSADAWYKLWRREHWPIEPLTEYLSRQNGFDLFHPTRPFYQAEDPRVSPKSVIHLIHSSANNPTLFSHETEITGISLTPAQAARSLVAAQSFRLGGLSGLDQKFTDAPLARGVVFLAQGDTLFETLALNLLRYPDDSVFPTDEDDKPAWEMDDPFWPERSRPLGYLDYLTWQTTRIRLFPEEGPNGVVVCEATIAPALRLASDVRDPMKHYSKRKKGIHLLSFVKERALWRDYHTLLELDSASDNEHPPAVFNWIATLARLGYIPPEHRYLCSALGMATRPGQDKVFFYRHQQMPLPLEYLQERDLAAQITSAIRLADEVDRCLNSSLITFAELVIVPDADQEHRPRPAKEESINLVNHWGVRSHYWNDLEPAFWQLVETLPANPEAAAEQWRSTLKQAARRSFEHAETLTGSTVDALKGAVRGRRQLEAGIAKLL